MSKYLDPKADLTFKKVFGNHKNLVMSLLNALLPLPEGMNIESVEYLPSENIPENPGKKYSIVDVYCTDNQKRHFIVEMQSYWNTEFFSRTLFNAASVYTKQLKKGMSFGDLKDVYSLCLVNDERAFNYKAENEEEKQKFDNEYVHEFYLINKNHPTKDVRTDLSMVFVILPKYKPQNRAEKKMHDLWLKFLTQIDENTTDAPEELLENEETNEALEIVRTSAYTESELRSYNQYWLDISTEKSALERERTEGREEGEKIGREKGEKIGREKGEKIGREEGEKIGREKGMVEGRKIESVENAKKMKLKNYPIEDIIEITGLTKEEIDNL